MMITRSPPLWGVYLLWILAPTMEASFLYAPQSVGWRQQRHGSLVLFRGKAGHDTGIHGSLFLGERPKLIAP